MDRAFFRQDEDSGGIHTAPDARILMYALAKLIGARKIVETGYDAGYTTRALALTGARVIGIDNLAEYGNVDAGARAMLAEYDNVTLVKDNALAYLMNCESWSVDLVFIDDMHQPEYVGREANEVERILRLGGIAVFHDTAHISGLMSVVNERFAGWQRLDLPAISPANGVNYGITVLRKTQ